MGGTSERNPPGRDRAPRHLHAVPPSAEDPGSGTAAEGGAGSGTPGEQDTTPGSHANGYAAAGPDGSGSGDGTQPAPGGAPGSAGEPASGEGTRSAAGGAPDSAGGPASGEGAKPANGGAPDGARGPAPAGRPAAGEPASLLAAPARHILAVAGLYVVLLVFGLLLGLTGAFQFSRSLGPVPVGAVLFVLAIGATCWLCGRGTGSVAGALFPAMGWIVASFSMAMPNTSGNVVITNSLAGEIYLYGGALCAAIGVGAAFGGWTRAQHAAGGTRSAGTGRPRP